MYLAAPKFHGTGLLLTNLHFLKHHHNLLDILSIDQVLEVSYNSLGVSTACVFLIQASGGDSILGRRYFTSISFTSTVRSIMVAIMWIFFLCLIHFVGICSARCLIWPSRYGVVSIDMTTIQANAFMSCQGLRYVYIGDSVRWINENAFRSCDNLIYVSIGNSVQMIGANAFSFCHKLQIVSFGVSVKSIGNSAFEHCGRLTFASLPESVTSIGDGAFRYCGSLESVSLPDGILNIGSEAFKNCQLFSVSIPGNVT